MLGLNGLIFATAAAAWPDSPPDTNVATSRISFLVSSPSNDGIPPPPLFTLATTSSTDGFASSRFGPTEPLDPAASSVWQLPQPASANTWAPGEELGSEPESLPPQPARSPVQASASSGTSLGRMAEE